MQIKYSCLRSDLSYNEDFKRRSEAFVSEIGHTLGTELILADLNDYDCDLKLIYVQTGGSENLFLQHIEVLREPYLLLTNGSNNSLAASLEIMTYIDRKGGVGEILHGNSDYIAKRITTLAKVEMLKKSLAGTTLGIVGQPSDWLISSIPAYDDVTAKFGIKFKHVSLDEIKKKFNSSVLVDKTRLPGVFSDDEKIKALRTYNAFKEVAKEYGLSGFTVRCFDLLKPLETTGCAGLALLNDEGITSVCEGDVAAMLSMHIVRLLTGQTSFQANPSRIDPSENTAVLAHCTIPLSMTEKFRLDTHFESGTGLAVKGELTTGDVTVFRMSADLEHFFVSDGRIIKNLDEPDLCRTQILIKFDSEVSELLKHPCGNHHIVFYGHHADEIRSVMREFGVYMAEKGIDKK